MINWGILIIILAMSAIIVSICLLSYLPFLLYQRLTKKSYGGKLKHV